MSDTFVPYEWTPESYKWTKEYDRPCTENEAGHIILLGSNRCHFCGEVMLVRNILHEIIEEEG
jgi:ribosomal protein L24E